ncbi:MAG TPA: hypothetical protein VH619_13365 [Verrucomicrobiae bacterium]|nr:hypothetical protein [Verrucomicrobiae bacterium]
MKTPVAAILLGIVCAANAQLEVLPAETGQAAFAGTVIPLSVLFHNPGTRVLKSPLRLRLYAAGSDLAAPLGNVRDWKTLEVLPGQTVLEKISLPMPAVRQKTPVLVQWLDDSNRAIGRTDVTVYPTNLLQALRPLTAQKPIGISDSDGALNRLLSPAGLETSPIANFDGKLAAFLSPPDELRKDIERLANAGAAVIWIKIGPTREIYCAPYGKGAVAILQLPNLDALNSDPLAQLDLIRAAELAAKSNTPLFANH